MSSISYGMGQIRYNSNTNYVTDLGFSSEIVKVSISSEGENADYYQDILLAAPQSFQQFVMGTPYLLRLTIPKDENYNTVFRIKLVETVSAGTDEIYTIASNLSNYQILKYINLPKTTESLNNDLIILYPVDENDNPWYEHDNIEISKNKVAIVNRDLNHVSAGDVIVENGNYYFCKPIENSEDNYDLILIQNKNTVILNHSWAITEVSDTVTYDIVFTPKTLEQHFKNIWIELYRENYDQDIFDGDYYGRRINPESQYFSAAVYELRNLITTDTDVSSFNHIGVYGHPNLIMAINGEEIHVGQSGYYELNDFEITSFAIAAHDNNDKFTVDYQYQQTTS